MIAFGTAAQSLVALGFFPPQNATSAARHQEDPTHTDAPTETTAPDNEQRPHPSRS
ncbi:hypothetical protein ACFU7T_20040 [Streptomyces sp. NPDC057555]|uniref:hypothetical protein n=1 Tax=Streptomyces sp. NPDC057555 TaxID=3346166 RepID=UPI00369AD1E0